MSLAEGVQGRVAYKAYASGAITANAAAPSPLPSPSAVNATVSNTGAAQ